MDNTIVPESEENQNDSLEAVRDLLFGKTGTLGTGEPLLISPSDKAEKEDGDGGEEEAVATEIMVKEHSKPQKRANRESPGVKRVEERMARLEEKLEQLESTFLDEIEECIKRNGEDISNVRAEILEKLNEELLAVANNASDRAELSDFLIDLGLRIQPDQSEETLKFRN